jgi:hypothetical protein
MSKTQITKEQLIARKGGWTSYYNAAGNAVKARNSAVEVVGEDESARSPAPKAPKPAKLSKRRQELGEEEDEGEDELDDGKRRVGNTRHDCSAYVKTKSASGNKTLDSGDALAIELRGLDLDAVYKRASKELGETMVSLHQRYDVLNPGMQRMNLGNRIRAVLRKREAVVADSAK